MTKTPHLLSIDLEDWFHILDNDETRTPEQWEKFSPRVEENTEKLLQLFEKRNVKASFFVLSWIAEKYPQLIENIHSKGHEIGSHSHAHPLIYNMTPLAFEDDLKKSIDIISNITGEKVIIYRAPGFSITKDCLWAFDILAKNGIKYDSSVFPAARAHGGIESFPIHPFIIKTKNGSIKEFPISTFNFLNKKFVFAGGGYFRLFPIKFLTSQFSKYEKNNKSVVTYLHPRDIDPRQPKLSLSKWRSFKSYVNLDTTLEKLNLLLQRYHFTTLTDVSENLSFDYKIELS